MPRVANRASTPADRAANLVLLAHARWVIEQFYVDAKQEYGPDDYQGRSRDGLHRHLVLVMLAYSFLMLYCQYQVDQKGIYGPCDSLFCAGTVRKFRRIGRRSALAILYGHCSGIVLLDAHDVLICCQREGNGYEQKAYHEQN
jgi:hypothetical protein